MDPNRTKRRHVRDKAVIDHLADKVFETSSIPDAERQSSTTDTGLSVENRCKRSGTQRRAGYRPSTRQRAADRRTKHASLAAGG